LALSISSTTSKEAPLLFPPRRRKKRVIQKSRVKTLTEKKRKEPRGNRRVPKKKRSYLFLLRRGKREDRIQAISPIRVGEGGNKRERGKGGFPYIEEDLIHERKKRGREG